MEHILLSAHDFDMKIGLLLFFAYMAIDALYASYTYLLIKKSPARAATVGAGMYFLIAFGVVNYVNNFFYVIPLVAGSWIGTYIIVLREKNKK